MSGRRRPLTGRLLLGAVLGPAIAVLPAACAFHREREARQIPQYGVIDPTQPRELDKVALPRYVIEPPDVLEVDVRPAALDTGSPTVNVQPDGYVDLGFTGDVYVAGMTLAQAEQRIAAQVLAAATADGEAPDEPVRVSVRLASPTRSKFYYVIGTVNTQGPFPYDGGETVLAAILEAGLRPNSLPEKAYLVRPTRPGEPDVVLRIDWFGIKERGDTTTNYQLFPGDRIVVPGTREPGLLGTLFGQ